VWRRDARASAASVVPAEEQEVINATDGIVKSADASASLSGLELDSRTTIQRAIS
jgi:hypothetical protein